MDSSEEEINDAIKTQRLVCQKLLEIMDLQGDIDALLRDSHPSPFGSAKWKNAGPEELQRLVLMTAIQFVLFEPDEWVQGNSDFKSAAGDGLAEHVAPLPAIIQIVKGEASLTVGEQTVVGKPGHMDSDGCQDATQHHGRHSRRTTKRPEPVQRLGSGTSYRNGRVPHQELQTLLPRCLRREAVWRDVQQASR